MPEIIFGPSLTVVCQHVTDGQRESLCMIEREGAKTKKKTTTKERRGEGVTHTHTRIHTDKRRYERYLNKISLR
jgi:hypothetical protein